MKSKLKDVLYKRLKHDDDSFAVIGLEIKNRRIALSRTLTGVSYKICSVSYLSKIENNKISPNKYYVKEICSKLDLSEEKIDILLNLRRLLEDTVIAFFKNDYKTIMKSKEMCTELTNYRVQLILLICYIYEKNIFEANKIYLNLLQLANSLASFDLIILTLFSGILHFYKYEFDDALLDLEILKPIEIINEVKLLRDIYLFYSKYALNNSDIFVEYDLLKDKLTRFGYYEILEDIHYVMGIYLAKNKASKQIEQIILLIKDCKKKSSLRFLASYFKNEKITKAAYSDKQLSQYCRLIKGILFDKEAVKSEIECLDDLIFKIDIDPLILKYLLLENNESRINYLDEIVMPRMSKTKEGFLIDYFLHQYSLVSLALGRYRKFVDLYLNFKRIGVR